MTNTPQDALQADPREPDTLGGSKPLTGRARSLANLRPPWTPEEARAANPSGMTKRGTPASTAKIDDELHNQLAKRMQTRRLVQRWIRDAIEDEDGSVRAKAREQILQRLYPVPQDVGQQRVVLEKLTLELSPGGGASASLRRASVEGVAAESFAGSERPESREWRADAQLPLAEPLKLQESLPALGPLPVVEVPTDETTISREGSKESARGVGGVE